MTSRGVDFLQNWIKNNVLAADQGDAFAAILATPCILEAAGRGIMVAHMEEGGPAVESFIKEAVLRLQQRSSTGDLV
jgi:hypothetical protein